MTRALILLGITALACRDKEPVKSSTPGSAAPPAVVADKPAPVPTAKARPELPVMKAQGSDSIAGRFASEEIDRDWKLKTEADLHARFKKMKHPPSDTDCRAATCQLTITGSSDDIAASIEELQSLETTAKSILLTQPQSGKLVAYLTFDREP